MEYLPRIVDTELDALAEAPAVSIEGARGVGKTATAMRRARTVHRLDDPGQLAVIGGDPLRVTGGEPPVLIDEWQRLPASWDLVRRAVDADPQPGRFLLTGSATPTEAPTHTGAGRIISMRMRPLSLAERGLAAPTVSLSDLLTGDRPRLDGAAEVGVEQYADEIVRSGFPGIRPHPDRIRRGLLDGYVDQILNHDVHQFGHTFRDEGSLRRWITAYAAAVSTATSFEKIRDAASAGEDDRPARTTTIPYRSALEGLRLIEKVPAWLPTRNRLRRVASAPVHQLTDPALAARLLGVGTDALIAGTEGWEGDGTLLGALFESLVTLSVRVYAQACEARVHHFRTQGGEREVDLIVERADGAVVALEVKLKSVINDRDVRHLQWLRDQVGSRMLDAAVLSTGRQAYRRADGIGVIPASLLGP
ncbi:MAG: ATP-binding protein [Acidimicrobiaceae bacterium]|nr:ATP-binding protein [Acidimicrobiaceae bacterium]MYE96591.1 ATP-binding protein [Acidimicrobiaceae bacterium]MYI53167.1 ATP-binding protein [Acidimicrobiaceae bacterium]